ncbi:MAG: hypothetical protein J7L03_06180 [Caldisericaceae bacterium]|nr:hypothetical protein [Caldisericaceae bacterium]
MKQDNNKKAYFNLFLLFLLIVAFLIYGKLFPQLSPVYVPQHYPRAVQTATVFVEPDSNDYPITDAIKDAKKSVDLEVYMLSDKYVINSLIDAKKRGVKVRVLLEENPYKGYGANKSVKDKLSHYGVETKWANRAYQLTHSKFLVIDGKTGYILTMNLTKSSFTKNREFGIVTDAQPEVGELEKIFQCDWNRKPYTPKESALIVSPENSLSRMEELINSARNEILIYAEEMENADVENLLIKKAKSGVKVNVILASPKFITSNGDSGKYLSQNFVNVKYLDNPFVHAKVVVIDRSVAYVGSINFSDASLKNNREVGIFVSNEDAIDKIVSTFYKDFENSYKNP